MLATRTLRDLSFTDASALIDEGAAFVDLRPIADYLDVHVPGSIALLYEVGPGMAARARDCLPLSLPLIILGEGHVDEVHAAASLRGKGFTVLGRVDEGVNAWASKHGNPASTEVIDGDRAPDGVTIVDVGDPGAQPVETARRIPADVLWERSSELADDDHIVIVSGRGVRAALAVGILERAGAENVSVWRRPKVRSARG